MSEVSECVIDRDGTKYWYLNGEYHRVDGPAIEDADGATCWYLHGKLHRVDGPAVEEYVYRGMARWWYFNGESHREGGPAIEDYDGYRAWYVHGKRHRVDGPAVEFEDCELARSLRGLPLEGPVDLSYENQWWINGEQLTELEFLLKTGKTR